ncbi:hypothetical protein HCH15_05290 [Corynebacterium testudinoris]|uniref:Uncharacterized protein n=1 Tax=Corynebacterium testudinoris TaxID=136857 RepID=A0A0G3H9Y3_9CORY|nr:hypothetical protein [Corynebacterium testudinoris]AKK07972.1 hypothetical protein CTEST_02585 [Corynebacterium testudinoris]MBX8995594.1 hypothetical protein [Corynebacterium testudinoris]
MVAERTNLTTQPSSEEIVTRAKRRAREMKKGSRREEIPVRTRFIRDVDAKKGEKADTPMGRLVKSGSRDGITLRLYLALLWRCSAEPYTTNIPARQWAELLGLAEPEETYARRITNALRRLEEANLIALERKKGQPSMITLLDESGDGSPYLPPRGSKDKRNRWVKIPITLWQNDEFYDLGTPGLAMMLAILAERNDPLEPMWWSIARFEQRIGLTPSTRARGLNQLEKAGLLTDKKQRMPSKPGGFAREAVRSTYLLHLEEHSTPRITTVQTLKEFKSRP